MKGLAISEVARVCGVNIETIRYYEKRGLIQEPPRTASGYRSFSKEVIERINFIKRAQELDFSLSEIQKLIRITDNDKNFTAEDAQQFAKEKLSEVEQKIRGLESVKSLLGDLLERCSGKGPICECPIIQDLSRQKEIQRKGGE
ncbi:MerR family transcriptional regulator [Radiobacillus sp. PE A8.2]|uniref:MerR family transcriptional regulator n=1 Tax=Radiobacillus sp. PE A8.2 TaxID=3380349 RepID=UPI00388F704A